MTKSQVKAVLVLLRMAETKFGFKFMKWLNNLKLFLQIQVGKQEVMKKW